MNADMRPMLYDVFICHASEDKEAFVAPLVERLRREHVEVWYDEFQLKLGDSIRQAIEKGLRQSRFGVVVLSKAFFAKRWPQYELDGLVEREMSGQARVLLPIWHGVEHDDVMNYSPTLAGRMAARTSRGLDEVVRDIVDVLRPQGSPLVHARDTLLEWGFSPPVITDEYWLDVVEASNRIPAFGAVIPEASAWGRWSFPLPSKEGGGEERGSRLAWTAMQMRWTDTAEQLQISPLTHPNQVHEFIDSHPGLFETCEQFPEVTAEYAPQLTIPGFEGPLAESIERAFRESCEEWEITRRSEPWRGIALSIDGKAGPLCDEEWYVRHPNFGNARPVLVAGAYFGGTEFGPSVSPYKPADHLIWLLSSASSWLPRTVHDVLLKGHGEGTSWLWTSYPPGAEEDDFLPALAGALWERKEGKARFRWTKAVTKDVLAQVQHTRKLLGLPEPADVLLERFRSYDLPTKYLAAARQEMA